MTGEGMPLLDLFETVKLRKSVRSYRSTPVPREIIEKVFEAARLAPSSGTIQPWHFIVVEDKNRRVRIAKGCRYGRFLARSPVVIAACGDVKASPRWYAIETAVALEHVVLAATALGLGTCWIGRFNQEDIREVLKIPENLEIVALLALGYPRRRIDVFAKFLHVIRPRKKLVRIVSYEVYGRRSKHTL